MTGNSRRSIVHVAIDEAAQIDIHCFRHNYGAE